MVDIVYCIGSCIKFFIVFFLFQQIKIWWDEFVMRYFFEFEEN